MAHTKNLADAILRELKNDEKLAAEIEREALAANIASVIYEWRNKAGLSQAELARRAGTYQSVIARMEDSDYSGHSISMLARIAGALNKSVHVEFRERFIDSVAAPAAQATASSALSSLPWKAMTAPAWTPKIVTEYTFAQVA